MNVSAPSGLSKGLWCQVHNEIRSHSLTNTLLLNAVHTHTHTRFQCNGTILDAESKSLSNWPYTRTTSVSVAELRQASKHCLTSRGAGLLSCSRWVEYKTGFPLFFHVQDVFLVDSPRSTACFPGRNVNSSCMWPLVQWCVFKSTYIVSRPALGLHRRSMWACFCVCEGLAVSNLRHFGPFLWFESAL